jgi:hypothetical protein
MFHELPGAESSRDRSWRLREGKQGMCDHNDYLGMSWSRIENWSMHGNGNNELFLITGRSDQIRAELANVRSPKEKMFLPLGNVGDDDFSDTCTGPRCDQNIFNCSSVRRVLVL